MKDPIPRPLPNEPLPLDLLNTEMRSSTGPLDVFALEQGVQAFAAAHGQSISDAELVQAKDSFVQTRAAIRALFMGEDPAFVSVNHLLNSARWQVQPCGDSLRFEVSSVPPHHPLAMRALVEAVELQRDRPTRIRTCAHPQCVLWFLDVTRSGTRRWCSMELCGNRSKAKRHYARGQKA